MTLGEGGVNPHRLRRLRRSSRRLHNSTTFPSESTGPSLTAPPPADLFTGSRNLRGSTTFPIRSAVLTATMLQRRPLADEAPPEKGSACAWPFSAMS